MDNFSLGMKETQGLEEFDNAALDEVLVESISPEHHFHVTQAHLRCFKDKDDVLAVWTIGFE
jgi:hypothetical protein